MPLASTFALQFFGPGCAAAVGEAVAESPLAQIKGNGRLGAVGTAAASSPFARPTRGRAMGAFNLAAASSPAAGIKGRGRMTAVGRVNQITQDDVTGAVLESLVEPGITLKQALRALLATAALGRTTGAGTAENRFRNPANTKDRIVVTFDGSGNRTSITADLD